MPNIWRTLRSRDETRSTLTTDQWADQWFSYQNGLYSLGGAKSLGSGQYEEVAQDFLPYVQQAYKANGVVFACCIARQLVFTEMRFALQRMRSGRPGDLFDDASLRLLHRPWPNGTTGELLARALQDTDFAGNHYVVEDGDRLRWLRPDWVHIVLARTPQKATFRDVVGYSYRPEGTEDAEAWRYYPADGSDGRIIHWCVDEETEILTTEGWKDYASLKIGDEALTLDHETGLSEWQPVTDVAVFPSERREMVSMEGKEFSSLTTPNHRWAVERRNSKEGTYVRRWTTSDSLGTGDRIPVAAYSSDVPLTAKWVDALVETVAWFWTEGWMRGSGKPGVPGRGVNIAQSWEANEGKCARIRAALTVLFGPAVDALPKRTQIPCWRESQRGDGISVFRLSAAAGDVITDHAPSMIVTTEFIRSLTKSQLDLFIEVSLLADNNGPGRLSQKSEAMRDQFAFACLLAGHGVSMRQGCFKDGVSSFGNGYRMHEARILRKRHVHPQENSRQGSTFRVKRVEYEGHVWCPRTPNQTWLARRHGSVYFTGNSPIPDPEFQYRGMSWMTPIIREILADKSATRHKQQFFDNAAVPNLAVSFKESVTAEQFNAFMEKFDAAHRGTENAYKTLYLGGGADVTPIGANIQQMDFKSSQGISETRIAAAARVHPTIVGLSEGLQGSSLNEGNYKAAKEQFGDGTMRPLWRSLCAAYEPLVAPRRNVRLWYDDRDIAFLRADRKDAAALQLMEAQTMRQLVDAGFLPERVVEAVRTQDWNALSHSGLYSVQLVPPGPEDPAGNGQPPTKQPSPNGSPIDEDEE